MATQIGQDSKQRRESEKEGRLPALEGSSSLLRAAAEAQAGVSAGRSTKARYLPGRQTTAREGAVGESHVVGSCRWTTARSAFNGDNRSLRTPLVGLACPLASLHRKRRMRNRQRRMLGE